VPDRNLLRLAVGRPYGGFRVHFLEFLQHLSLYRYSLLCTYCTNSENVLVGTNLAQEKGAALHAVSEGGGEVGADEREDSAVAASLAAPTPPSAVRCLSYGSR
jgi:hypothetical protein